MFDFIEDVLPGGFMPHGHCYLWRPGLLWLHVGSDTLIAASYFSIPVALYLFVRRRSDLAFPWIFSLFAAFIFFCGMTHLLEIWTVWEPTYWLEGTIKLITALVSLGTAVVLWPLMRPALALPSPAQLRGANDELASEIEKRRKAEHELRELNTELERRVREQTEELRRSNEDLQQFAYMASHDLQEPLRMITSYMQLLERRYKGRIDEKANTYIHYAVDGANRMRGLIDDLLSYSRANTNAQVLDRVDLGTLMQRAVHVLRRTIDETGGHVTWDRLPVVYGDETQLTQVLQNILSNALKYRREGVPPEVHVTAERRPDEHVVSVHDNGIGIAPEHQEKIFEIFRRLHLRGSYSGSGIGLAIIKRLVERHGGRVWVDSTPGSGTTVSFTLPVRASAGEEGEETGPVAR